MSNIFTILKYMDIFGIKYTFYGNKRPKLYTVTGGILSIISIFFCTLIPILFSLDDIKRVSPSITESSIPSEGYRKIKFGEEKIWIPWRMVDYNDNIYVNHTGLFFPIIYYIFGTKNKETNKMNIQNKILNYKLCNETSMSNNNDIYKINVPLNELYCIDMEELYMGGSWISDFINLVQFDLYYCEDGINYNKSNPKCTSYDKIINYIGQNNSIRIAFYYPTVEFQPTNKNKPILIIYNQHFFHISKYTNKIDRIYLQEYVLTDDSGLIIKNEVNHSYWGLNSISGDNYFIGGGKDLMNEGSNSRAYSFNIYLEPGIILYKRKYKKLHSIIADALPYVLIIFYIFKYISKLFKFTEGNKKMIELLFENLKESPIHYEENNNKVKTKPNHYEGRLSFNKVINQDLLNIKNKIKSKASVDNILYNKNSDYTPSISINKKRNRNLSISNINKNLKSSSKFVSIRKSNLNNMSNQHLILTDTYKKKDIYQEEKAKNKNQYKYLSEMHIMKNNNIVIRGKLFPFKYYFCSVFIKNLDISKNNLFVSARFAKVYTFICQLFDITTYLKLQREFNVLKNSLSENKIKLIENNDKINVNSKNFLKDISYCIGEQKLHILAQNVKK